MSVDCHWALLHLSPSCCSSSATITCPLDCALPAPRVTGPGSPGLSSVPKPPIGYHRYQPIPSKPRYVLLLLRTEASGMFPCRLQPANKEQGPRSQEARIIESFEKRKTENILYLKLEPEVPCPEHLKFCFIKATPQTLPCLLRC